MFTVKVPATSANLGPGFDCMGIALNLYNETTFEPTNSEFEIEILDESSAFVPKDSKNLIYRAMDMVYKAKGEKLYGIKVTTNSSIPLTRGLGSSSSAIIAGLVGANHILSNPFTNEELLYMAYKIEGHPDNVTPALVGGFSVSYPSKGKITYLKTEICDDIKFVAFIPDFYFQTKKSRSIIPNFVSLKNTAYNIARASMLSMSFATGDFSKLDTCLRDKIHQNVRFNHIKSGEYIIRNAKRCGAYGGYISGAGPTIMTIVPKENYESFLESMNKLINESLTKWRLVSFMPDNDGTKIINN